MTEKFAVIGLCACFYAIARLLHYASLKLQDDPDGSVLCPILTGICCVLWLLALPVTIVFYFLNKLHTERLCSLVRQESKDEVWRAAELFYKQPPSKPSPEYHVLDSTSHIFDTLAESLISYTEKCLIDIGLPVSVPSLLIVGMSVIHTCVLAQNYREVRHGLETALGLALEDSSFQDPYPNERFNALHDEYEQFKHTLEWYPTDKRDAVEAAIRHAFPDIKPCAENALPILALAYRFNTLLSETLGGSHIIIPRVES